MSITIITEDEFGKTVAQLLRRRFDIEQISLTQGLERDWSKDEYGLAAVCTDRPYFAAFEQLSDCLMKANVPLTFSYINDSILSIGPLVIPGKSPCYRCYRRRLRCHLSPPWSITQERVVQTEFNRDWGLRLPGMLPSTPVLVAARLGRHALLREHDYGLVTHVTLTESRWQEFLVRRVHGCDCLPSFQTAAKSDQPTELAQIVDKLFL